MILLRLPAFRWKVQRLSGVLPNFRAQVPQAAAYFLNLDRQRTAPVSLCHPSSCTLRCDSWLLQLQLKEFDV